MGHMKSSLHPLLKLAWNLRILWRGLTGKQLVGAQVLVWYQDSILIIQNSYREGYYLPGGGIGRGELPVCAAARELREETGIVVNEFELEDLGPVNYEIQGVPVRDYIYKVSLRSYQEPLVDGLEVTDANFWRRRKVLKIPQLQHLHQFLELEKA